ncbi:MAG: hypothetical protein RSF93_06245 [Mucinivorans sp.]
MINNLTIRAAESYVSPLVEVIEVTVEQGIAASSGSTEGFPEDGTNPW